MTQTTTLMKHPPRHWWLWALQQRSIQLTLAGWLIIAIAIQLLAGPSLPFNRPSLADQPVGTQIFNAHSLLVLALMVIAVANLVTPHRVAPDIASRVPARSIAHPGGRGVERAFGINFSGTVLPVMIYLYAILLTRFLKLSGSAITTTVLYGLGYAAMHVRAIAPHAWADAPNMLRIFGVR
jgi:hypothetical protein